MRFGISIFLILLVRAGAAWCYIGAQMVLALPSEITYQEYQGRYHFTPEEYSSFKQYLADNPEVRIIKMDVYSSPDPLVDFTLSVNSDLQIPYGRITESFDTNNTGKFAAIVSTTTILAFSATVIIYLLSWGKKL